MSAAAVAANVSSTITFSEYPVGTLISDQYANDGVVFSGPSAQPEIVTDAANPTSPVLEGGPNYRGDVEGAFVVPGTSRPAAVDSFSLDVGYIDQPGSVVLYVYGAGGMLLGTISADSTGIVHMTSTFKGATSFLMHSASTDTAGWAIDNVALPTPYAVSGSLTFGNVLGAGEAMRHNSTCNQGENPVNCASGDFWHTFTDARVPGRGPGLDLTRTYNSLAAGDASMFGPGWHSSYDMAIAPHQDGSVTVRMADGSGFDAQPDPAVSGSYSVPAWADSTLSSTGSGGWKLVRRFSGITYTFGGDGKLVSEADRNGETTTLSYDQAGNLARVTDLAGRSLSLTYNGDGTVASLTDPAGQETTYGYNAGGELASVTDPLSRTWRFGYTADGSHLLTTMTDPRGDVLSNVYDSTGRVTSQTDFAGRTTSFGYTGDAFSSDGGTTTITDPRGTVETQQYTSGLLTSLTKGKGTPAEATWTYGYDPVTFAVVKATDPDGHLTSSVYDQHGNPVQVTNALNDTTTSTFNDLDEPTSVTLPSGLTTDYAYDAAGNRTTMTRGAEQTTYSYGDPAHPGDLTGLTDPTGHTWSYGYDDAGNLTSVTDPTGHTTISGYDQLGRRTSLTTARGKTTSYAYDADGELTKVTDPAGGVTAFGYDAGGDQTSVTDPDGNTTTTGYNADGQATTVTRADNSVLSYSYDQAGNQTGQTNAAGKTTTYSYDPLDRVVSMTDPLGRATSFGYDGAGNRTSMTDPAGKTTSYSYDPANRLTGIDYADADTPDIAYAYDADGLRTSMTDGTGTTSYGYDNLDRLTSVTDGAGKTVGYGYDPANRVTTITYPGGKTVTRGYDAAGRMTSVSDWNNHTTGFGYDADGNLTGQDYPNGVTGTITRDATGAASSITDTGPGGATLASFAYTRDPNSQVTGETSTGTGQPDQSYGYNPLNQLASRNSNNYAYDAADNLTRLPNGAQIGYDAADEATSYTDPAGTQTSFGYDQSGNRLTGLTPDGSAASYGYDQANRLTSATTPRTGASGSQYHPVSMARLADTRDGTGSCTPSPCAPFTAGGSLTIQVGGNGGIPTSGVKAVVLNVTALNSTANGYLVAYPAGQSRPAGRSLSITSGTAQSNAVVTSLSSDGKVTVYSNVATDVLVEVSGWYADPGEGSGSVFEPITGSRILDTRNGTGACTPTPCARLAAAGTTTVQVGGQGGVPASGVTAVVFTLTAFDPDKSGHAIAWPTDQNRPGLRNLSYTAATDASELVVVQPSAQGQVSLYTSAASDFTIDLAGYYTASADGTGSIFVPYDATSGLSQRILDTRNGTGDCDPAGCGTLQADAPVAISVAGHAGVPAEATAVVATATAWNPTGDGALVFWPTDGSRPPGRNLSYSGVTTSGTIQIALSPQGKLDAEALWKATDLTLDVQGWFEPVTQTTTYGYDGDGLRANATTDSTITQFTWDTTAPVPALLSDDTHDFIYGPDGTPIEQITIADGTTQYLHGDQYGSTRLITDTTGTVVATYAYTPYGQLDNHTGTADTPLRWNGQYQDVQTGLYYLRNRYYDPGVENFLTRDPLVALTQSPYAYAANNPLNARDPLGLCWGPTCWSAQTWTTVGVGLIVGGVALATLGVGLGAGLGAIAAVTGAESVGAIVDATATASLITGATLATVGTAIVVPAGLVNASNSSLAPTPAC